jgi:hypothetical protein
MIWVLQVRQWAAVSFIRCHRQNTAKQSCIRGSVGVGWLIRAVPYLAKVTRLWLFDVHTGSMQMSVSKAVGSFRLRL